MRFSYNRYFLPFLLAISVCCTAALFPGKAKKDQILDISGSKYARINDTLYAGVYEVTNFEYKEFLNDLKDSVRTLCRIDSAQWVKKFPYSYNDPMAINYHVHPAFNNYPVVNISFYAARKYCAWLTYRYGREKHKQKLLFRLPTENEWALMANADPATCLPYLLYEGRRPDGTYLGNLRWIKNGLGDFAADGGFYTVRVDSYWPNAFGLYNIIGNAAEMTTQENIEKGGSWFDLLGDSGVDKQQNYTTPDPRVGFRVVAVLSDDK